MSIEVYTNSNCAYCDMAKQLLAEHGMAYVEKKLGVDFTREFILEQFPGQTAYPVIIVDGFNVGGYNGLKQYLNTLTPDDTRTFLVD